MNSALLEEVVSHADGDNSDFLKLILEHFPGSEIEVNAIGYDSITSAIGHGHIRGLTNLRSGTIIFDPRIHNGSLAKPDLGSFNQVQSSE